jgi:hypothetical protein
MTRAACLLVLGIGALALIAASGSVASASSAWCARTSFHFKDAQFQYVQDKFAEAQVLLTVMPQRGRGAAGTAFLIQASPPVLLTAGHVVKMALQDPSVPIVGYVATVPTREVLLQVVASHPSEDLALLTTVNGAPYPVPDVRPFEVNVHESFARPGMDVAFPGMAFISSDVLRQVSSSVGNDQDELMVSPDLAIGSYPSGGRTFRTNIYDGDSGAPVFLTDGMVAAVVTTRRGTITAEIVPLHEVVDWLIEELSAMQPDNLMHRLLEGGEDYLFQALNPQRCRSCLTNLQLLIAARKLSEADAAFRFPVPLEELLVCPLRVAMNQRGLFEAREWMEAYRLRAPSDADEEEPEVNSAELMQQSLQTAAYLVQHRPVIASALIDDIEPRLVRRLDDDISQSAATFYERLCLARAPFEQREGVIEALQAAGLTDTAEQGRQIAHQVSCNRVYGIDDWAVQLNKLADLQALHGNLGTDGQERERYAQALGTASLAALFANSREQLAVTYLTIARTAELVGDQDTSIRAIASARLETMNDPELASEVARTIEEAPAVMTPDFRNRTIMATAARDTMGEGPLAQFTVDEIIGSSVVDEQGWPFASVDDVVFDSDDYTAYAVLGVGGLFGIGQRTIAVPMANLEVHDEDNLLLRGLTEEELEAKPEYDRAESVSPLGHWDLLALIQPPIATWR